MPDNESAPNQSTNQPTPVPQKGYGKRPLWQWIVLYIVIAAVLYTAVYLLFFSGHSAGGVGSGNY